MKYALPNGIVLDTDGGMAPTLTHGARRKGFGPDLTVCLATHPDGMQVYVIAEGPRAIFESTSAEAIAARIDIMALDRMYDGT